MLKNILILVLLLIGISYAQKVVKVYQVGTFSNNRCAINVNDKWGFIDKEGNIVVEPKYLNGRLSDPMFSFNRASLRKVTSDGIVWGAIDTTGYEVIPFKYQAISDFFDSLGFVYTPASASDGTSTAHQSIIHISGFKLFEKAPVDYDFNAYYKDGMAKVRLNYKYGFINYLGMMLVPDIYDGADDFSENLAAVQDKASGKWGYVNKLGLVIVPFFSDVKPKPFSCKRAFYEMYGRKLGIIDNKGNKLTEPNYDIVYSFKEGVAAVHNENEWQIIDTNLVVIAKWNEEKDGDNFLYLKSGCNEGLFLATKYDNGNKFGYIDKTGKVIIPFIFDNAEPFSCGRAEVKYTNPKTNEYQWGFIDKSGKLIIRLEKN